MTRSSSVVCITMIVAVALVFGFQVFRPSRSALQPGHGPGNPAASPLMEQASGTSVAGPSGASDRSAAARTAEADKGHTVPTPTEDVAERALSPSSSDTADAPQLVAVHRLIGTATWYCGAGSRCPRGYGPGCLCAAAGAAVRAALGASWRGRYVTVSRDGRVIRVKLVDAMRAARLLDLFARPFDVLGSLSDGVMTVRVTW